MIDPYADTGWPRPLGTYTPTDAHPDERAGERPVPWVLGRGPDGVAWKTFHDDCDHAHDLRLCTVCGEPLAGIVLLGRYVDDSQPRDRETNGPGCHPRCMALTVKFCPHFPKGEDAVVAYRYDGPGTGYAQYEDVIGLYSGGSPVHDTAVPVTRRQAKELARDNPLGVTADDAGYPRTLLHRDVVPAHDVEPPAAVIVGDDIAF